MRQSLRTIRLFVAVYEERSFTAAAQREHATQSGVSQHVSQLEDDLGVRLFNRGIGTIRPTPAGSAYYAACLDVLNAHERATRSVRAFQTSRVGEITVGLMPSMTRAIVAPAFERFHASNPNVVVRVVDAYSGELTDRVRGGDLAFAIVPAIGPLAGVRTSLFARTPELLVRAAADVATTSDPSPPRSPAHGVPVRLASLGALRLVVPGPGNARRQSIEAYLAANGVTVERLLEFDTMFGTLDLVARGHWSAILPAVLMAPDLGGGSFAIHPIVDPPFALDLFLIEPARTMMPESAIAFLHCLRDETARIGARIAAFTAAGDVRPTA